MSVGMSGHGVAHRAGPALSWLAHPVTVGALVVLIANDHWWKQAAPGPVTGKLSDVAGLLLLPPLLAVLARLPAVAAIAVTGAGFVVCKAFAFGADAASALWTVLSGPSVIRQDVTDLIALPALGFSWWIWTRARDRPVSGGFVARIVLVPLALLGVVATSAPQYPRVDVVADREGTLVLGRETYYHEGGTPTWLTSDDAGRTWTGASSGPVAVVSGRAEDCVNADPFVCYRIVPGRLAVEESADGGRTWRLSWEVDDEARRILAADVYPDVTDVGRHLSSRAIVVWPDGAAYVVLVANGRDGYARRDADGTWQRFSFEPYSDALVVRSGEVSSERTAAARFADLPAVFVGCALAGTLVALVAGFVAAARVRRRLLLLPGALVTGFGAFLALPAAIPDYDFAAFAAALSIGFVAVGWALGLGLAAVGGAVTPRWTLTVAVLSATVTLLCAAMFVAWGAGVLAPLWLAVAVAVATLAAGLIRGVVLGRTAQAWSARGRPSKSTDE
jgi:hypothetical protein